MKKIIFIVLVFVVSFLNAQIAENGYPLSFTTVNLKSISDLTPFVTPSFDVNKLIEEDKITDLDKSIPPRFGFAFDVKLNIFNAGSFHLMENGDRVWRIKIKSQNAKTINFQMQNFYLVDGVKLYIYNENRTQLAGAYTSKNNKLNKVFASSLFFGDEIVIELNEPKALIGQSTFDISKIVHGYRSLKDANDFGTSGSCNKNVVCPEGDDWRKEIRAAAMILLADGTRWCSGSLINNVREDNTPYFLTAEHCIIDFFGNLEDVSNWIYMFNYESSNCSTTVDGSTLQTLQGSSIVSHYDTSDFALLLLDEIPPLDYNVYYAGWSARDTIADSVVCIHHPDGDVKKISFEFDTIEHSGYFSTGNSHWKIPDWDTGTTEPGSSGSPLYNKNHQIIGQLHGGDAKCSNDLEDYFGKFSVSWDSGSVAQKRLKDWLDPDTTNILDLNGADFNQPVDSFDAALRGLQVPYNNCGAIVDPTFTIWNYGGKKLTSAIIKFVIDSNSVDSISWVGLLNFGESEIVSIPTVTLLDGLHNIKIYCERPNDSIDEKHINDTIRSSFYTTNGAKVKFRLKSDNKGSETRVKLSNDAGKLIYFYPSFANNVLIEKEFCLIDDCYTLLVTDKGENGICCDFGNGFFDLMVRDSIVRFDAQFTDTSKLNFCLNQGEYSDIAKERIDGISIYPNPSNGKLYVNGLNIKNAKMEIYNLLGEKLVVNQLDQNENYIDLTYLESGIYIVQLKNNSELYSKKIILQK